MNKGTIDIEGVIGWEVLARDIKRELKDMGEVDEIDVFINSPGGYIDDGFGTFTALKNHSAKINMHITGMAASMGSVIAMAGDTVTIEETGMMMIHPPASIAWGTAVEMRKEADVLDKYESRIATAYKRRDLNISNDELSEAIADETWYTAQEALEAGFVDAVTDGEQAANEPSNAAIEWLRVARYKNAPESVAKQIKTNRAKASKLANKLITNDGSAVETHERENMSDEKTYSEADLETAVEKAVAKALADVETKDDVAVALMNEEGATLESVKAAMDMGLNAEQAKKFMAYAASNKSGDAEEGDEAESEESDEVSASAEQVKKVFAAMMAGSDVNAANKLAVTDDDKPDAKKTHLELYQGYK